MKNDRKNDQNEAKKIFQDGKIILSGDVIIIPENSHPCIVFVSETGVAYHQTTAASNFKRILAEGTKIVFGEVENDKRLIRINPDNLELEYYE